MIFKFDKGFQKKNDAGQWVTVDVVEIRGASDEEKPDGYAEGSVFIETDTGKRYMFDGEQWHDHAAE